MRNESENSSSKRNTCIFILILIVVFLTAFGLYYFHWIRPYHGLLLSADKEAASDNFDRAINLYTQAETYKKDFEVDKKIKLAGVLKNSKASYDKAEQEMKSKNYLGAIDIFKKVDSQDTKRYGNAQSKINECRRLDVSGGSYKDIAEDNKSNDYSKIIQKNENVKNDTSDITVDEAVNILKSKGPYKNNKGYSYIYITENIPKQIVDNYYAFGAIYMDEGQGDIVFCVNKRNGEMYVLYPSGKLMSLSNYESVSKNLNY